MVRKNYRIQRISQEIKKSISMILLRLNNIEDLNLRMVTISCVKISSDFSTAKIFITSLYHNTEQEINLILIFLNKIVYYIRRMLRQMILLRIIPKLYFYYDYSVQNILSVLNILQKNIKIQER